MIRRVWWRRSRNIVWGMRSEVEERGVYLCVLYIAQRSGTVISLIVANGGV
jgi:hypothetical protein